MQRNALQHVQLLELSYGSCFRGWMGLGYPRGLVGMQWIVGLSWHFRARWNGIFPHLISARTAMFDLQCATGPNLLLELRYISPSSLRDGHVMLASSADSTKVRSPLVRRHLYSRRFISPDSGCGASVSLLAGWQSLIRFGRSCIPSTPTTSSYYFVTCEAIPCGLCRCSTLSRSSVLS